MRPRRPDGEGRDDINSELDSGVTADGILEVMPDGYGFIRCENYLPGEHDVYVSPSQIPRYAVSASKPGILYAAIQESRHRGKNSAHYFTLQQ